MPGKDGFVKMWRSIDQSDIADDYELRILFLDLVRWANWKPKTLRSGTKLARGQLVVSQVKLGKAYRCGKTTVHRRLSALSKMGMIICGQVTGQSGTLVTICNYSFYQDGTREDGQASGQVADSLRTGSGQVADTEEEGRRLEGRRLEGKKKTKSAVDATHRPAQSESNGSVVVDGFPVLGGKNWDLRQTKFEEWVEAFPAVDVAAEVRVARQWLRDNPKRRKKDVNGFLSRWLARCQEKGGNSGMSAAANASQKITAADLLEGEDDA